MQSGIGPDGKTWTATSLVVGQTPTGTVRPDGAPLSTTPGGGNPIYQAPNSAGFSGVVGLGMYTGDFTYGCSGTLIGDRTIVTAAHCIGRGGGVVAGGIVKTSVYFQDDATSLLDKYIFENEDGILPHGVTAIEVTNYAVNSAWDGDYVIDHNDIAVLTLAQVAPAYATRYELYDGDLKGKEFTLAGYGARSSVGGELGADLEMGFRRQGQNTFDFAWGDPAVKDFFTVEEASNGDWFPGPPERAGSSYIADFDNGKQEQNASCRLAQLAGLSEAAANADNFCGLGVGPLEAMIASGDSGGGAFIDGKLAAVASYSIGFGRDLGDLPGESAFRQIIGYSPISLHTKFIRDAIAAAVPEPATWAQMLLGFGMIGVATRRRRRQPEAVTA